MKATIYVNGVIGDDTNLLDVIRQFKSFSNPTEVEVIINSVGGSVDSGMSIFNYLRNLNIPVTTIAKQAYSIAASIFMAGDNRIVEAGSDRIMIHFPWASVAGGSQELEMVAKELKAIEKDFIQFYSNYTSIDENAIKDLLQNETFLSGDEAFTLGLATMVQVPLAAVAYYNKENENKMTKTQKFLKAMADFFKESELNALLIQDANGVEINFPDVAEGDEPQVGDKAEIDGQPATGEVVMPDGTTMVFDGGALTEVKPSEETEEAPVEDTVEEEASAEAVEESTEELVENTTEELVEDSTEELDVEAFIKMIEESITARVSENIKSENKELKAEILAMKKLVGSEQIAVQVAETKTNTNNNNDLPKSVQILSTLRKNK